MPSDTFQIPLVVIYKVKYLGTSQNLALHFFQCIYVFIDSVGGDLTLSHCSFQDFLLRCLFGVF